MDQYETGRRGFVATTCFVAISGCSVLQSGDSGSDSTHSDTRNVREVNVGNLRAEPVTVAVQVEYESSDSQFSHVYSLSPREYDSGEELSGVPQSVTAFTSGGSGQEWSYGEPSTPICEALDVEILVESDGFTMNKPC